MTRMKKKRKSKILPYSKLYTPVIKRSLWLMYQVLVPPDLKRCQRMIQHGNFMTLGPIKVEQCENAPAWVATENKPGDDGRKGSMSLCTECAKLFLQMFSKDHATLITIKEFKDDKKIRKVRKVQQKKPRR